MLYFSVTLRVISRQVKEKPDNKLLKLFWKQKTATMCSSGQMTFFFLSSARELQLAPPHITERKEKGLWTLRYINALLKVKSMTHPAGHNDKVCVCVTELSASSLS